MQESLAFLLFAYFFAAHKIEGTMSIEQAIAEARRAYEFTPNSYTYWAFLECLKAQYGLDVIEPTPSWIEAYEEWRAA